VPGKAANRGWFSMVWVRGLGAVILAVMVCGAGDAIAQLRRDAAVQPPRQGAPKQAAPGEAAPGQPPAPEMRIAAVVNDEVISVFDVVTRMRMIMVSSGIPDSPETRQKIGSQVLRSLIDEKLELQEAKRQNVTATDRELNAAMQQIEKQNNLRSGQLMEALQSRGIDKSSLIDQITASIVWAKLVRRLASQTVELSDDEIEEATKLAREHAKEPQSRVAEIFLSVDNPAQDDEVRQMAERLTQQMRQGARFSAVARQFSQSPTAAVGGDIGWVRPDQVAPGLAKEVAQLKVGELSRPIQTGGGYYLLLVLERRAGAGAASGGGEQEIFDIVQVVFPLPPRSGEAARRAAIAEAESVRAAAKDCPALLKIGKEKAPQLSSEGKLRSNEISPQMRNIVSQLGVGHASQPIVQKNGVGVIMVCSKSTGGGATIATSREEVTETLIRQRLDTVSRRYLRDLRRKAYVDVRAGQT
jgi:peptidyl-prolyl cis-trans isomerase SurA